jgi:D-xylose transport system substrate-binding protein
MKAKFRLWGLGLLAIGVLAVLVLAACGGGGESKTTGTTAKGKGPTVALLLPENVTARWEGQDRPRFTAALKQLVPNAQVQVYNALNDPATQQSQAESALVKGAKVLVVAAVDQKAAAVIVNDARRGSVPVIAYDRLIRNSPLSAYVSFDSVAVGRAEAGWLAEHTKDGDRIVIINGSPTDDNAHLVNQGTHQMLDPLFTAETRLRAAEQWVPGWDPSKAQATMEQILTRINNKVDGVASANDGMAGGIIAALKAQRLAGKVPVTGQDATIEGLQRVVLGTQGMSVFKDIREQAKAAAQVAAAYLQGKKPTMFNGKVNNGQLQVPSVLLKVQPIDKSNIDVLLQNGYITKSELYKGLPTEVQK